MIQRHPDLVGSDSSSVDCDVSSEPSELSFLDGNGGAEKMFLDDGGGSDNNFLFSAILSSISVNYVLVSRVFQTSVTISVCSLSFRLACPTRSRMSSIVLICSCISGRMAFMRAAASLSNEVFASSICFRRSRYCCSSSTYCFS
jgi:hypothetical protein